MAEYTGWKPALTAALSKVGETIAVEQITLTAPLAYTLPTGLPSGVVHSTVFTQDNTGGHTVTFDGSPLSIAASGATVVEFTPLASGWRVTYPEATGSGGGGGYPVQRMALTAPVTLDPSGWPTTEVVTLVMTQDTTGNRVVTLPASVVTASGVSWAPGNSPGAESVAVFRHSPGLAKWVCEGCWVSIAGGVPTDVTTPTVGTLGVSNLTNTGFTLTVTGATDTGGLHATPYSFTIDGGTTWSAYQASAVYVLSGLTANTGYAVNWRVRDAAGNVSTGTQQTVTTASSADTTPPVWAATFTAVGTPTASVAVFQASAMATDNVGVAAYEVSYNGGTTWTTITPAVDWTFQLQGTGGTTYSDTKMRARDAAGNTSTPVLSVPSYTMAPAQALVVWDDFNRADGPLTTTTSGHTWELLTGTRMPVVSGNKLLRGFTGGVSPKIAVQTGITDMYVSCKAWVGAYPTYYARLSDLNNYYSVELGNNGTTPKLYRTVAGSTSSTGANVNCATGDRVGLLVQEEGNSTRLKIMVNGMEAYSYLDSNATRPTGTKAGIFVNSVDTGGWDDFEVRQA